MSSVAPAHIDLPEHLGKGLRFCRGDTIKVRVPMTGTPPPSAEWSRSGKAVETIKALAPRLDVQGTRLHTTLIVFDCRKADEGTYTLTVTNHLGAQAVDIPIYVVGKLSCIGACLTLDTTRNMYLDTLFQLCQRA